MIYDYYGLYIFSTQHFMYIFFLSNALSSQLEFKSFKLGILFYDFLFPIPNLILEALNKYLLVSKDG